MAERMSAGRLFERIAFDKPTAVSDGQGGTINGWEEQFQCRAHYRFLRGGETVQAARLEGRQPLIITVRSSSETRQVEVEWRIRDVRSGTIFQVKAPPTKTEDRRLLEILAESGVAG